MRHTYKNPFTKLLTATVLLSSPASVLAQGMINNGAKLTVDAGTFLNIDNGGFINETNGEVTNNGTMRVEGDWVNNDGNGVFSTSPSSGEVIMNGANQDIRGNEPTNFYNLTVEGSDHKSLVAVDANVFNQLDLNGRSLRLNTNTLDIENSAATAITGSGKIISETGPGSGGYGVLRWNIGTNTGNYTIPFGTDAASPADLTFQYNITTAGGPTSNYKTFSTYVTDPYNSFDETTYPNITPGPYPSTAWDNLPNTVEHLTDDYIQAAHRWVVDRFWIIDEENIGEGQGGYLSRPQIEYVFKYAQAEVDAAPNHIDESKLIAQRYNHDLDKWGDWLYGVPTVINDPASNEVAIQIAQDAGTWNEDMYPVWTLVDNSDPLPIELVRFVGVCDNGEVEVKWTTWTETENDFFTLERSENGSDFEEVEIIEGAGNSNQPLSYTVVDREAYSGTSYYRLKDTDFAGKSSYSNVIAVTCGSTENDFKFENAYESDHRELVVEFTAKDNEDYTIYLFDASGRRVMDYTNVAYDGMNRVRLDAGDLARGIYIINLSNGTVKHSERVMLR